MWNTNQPGNPDAADEFFIGYAPPMPPLLSRFVRRVVIGLACGALLCAATIAAGHVPLEGGVFEFGHPVSVAGTIVERPYPALRPDGGGETTPALLLVAPGKHGADALVSGLEGRHVTLIGTRVQRGAHTMFEVNPGSVVSSGPAARAPAGTTGESTRSRFASFEPDDGLVTIIGEIVDSKCFLGVMVPGEGKTHKECASLCLRGGIPPAVYARDDSGRSSLLLLTGRNGEPVDHKALQVAGEAITLTGTVERRDGWLVLRSDPGTWHPIGRSGT